MQAIILAGGFGTRLQAVVKDLPKPMAPIRDIPFLAYLMDYLIQQDITHVVLSVFYLGDTIKGYFGSRYKNLAITYITEASPLGTGGAIQLSLSAIDQSQAVFVLNGDTFVRCDYPAMFAAHQSNHAKMSMALRAVDECSRYGKVVVENNLIINFKEKGEEGAGLINAGVYLLEPHLFTSYNLPHKFSFETDFLYPEVETIRPHAFIVDDYFIDIGIPEDYARAQIEL